MRTNQFFFALYAFRFSNTFCAKIKNLLPPAPSNCLVANTNIPRQSYNAIHCTHIAKAASATKKRRLLSAAVFIFSENYEFARKIVIYKHYNRHGYFNYPFVPARNIDAQVHSEHVDYKSARAERREHNKSVKCFDRTRTIRKGYSLL